MSMAAMRKQYILTALGLALTMGCGGKGDDTASEAGGASAGPAPGCSVAMAEAGDAQTFPLGALISLNGSESSWCDTYKDDEINFTWSFERTPTDSSISDGSLSENRESTSVNPTFVPDVPGEYVLSLRVTDPATASDPDFVIITISSNDVPPLANCGEDVIGKVGLATTLNGHASSDPEGAGLEFAWGVSSTPTCSSMGDSSIFDQGTPTPSIIPDCDGIYVLSLVVSDGLQWSDPDYCSVDARSDNAPPVAETGMGGSLPSCADNPFRLSGWESYDPDGDALTYIWSVVSTPVGADPEVYGFDDSASVGPYFTWDKTGEWSFQLQVNDGVQTSPPDLVTYIIGGDGGNNSPTANAGGDQTVEVQGACESSATCEACPETNYSLDGTSSSDPDGDTLNYSWSEGSGMLGWTGTTTPVTDLIFPAMDSIYLVSTTMEYTVQLEVSDCSLSDDDLITVTYTCRGEYVSP
jgi:hypothetical protein